MSQYSTNPDGRSWSEETQEVCIVLDAGTLTNPGDGVVRLDGRMEYVHKVKVIETLITGVPLTAGKPNYDYIVFQCGNISTSRQTDGLKGITMPVTGETTRTTYNDRVVRADSASAINFVDIPYRVLLPDKRPATASDYDRIIVTLQITQRRPRGSTVVRR